MNKKINLNELNDTKEITIALYQLADKPLDDNLDKCEEALYSLKTLCENELNDEKYIKLYELLSDVVDSQSIFVKQEMYSY